MRALLTIVLFSISLHSFSQTWQELNDSLIKYYNSGEYYKGVVIGEKALIAAKKQFGESHPDYATSLNNLALLYFNVGEYAKVEPLYIKASLIWKKTLGENHPEYATSLNNLAQLYENMGEFPKAQPLYTEAMRIYKKSFLENHPKYATTLNNLAGLYKNMGEYAKAEPLYIEVIGIRKKTLSRNHPDYATSLNNLAGLYNIMGQYAKAEPLYTEAMAIRKKTLGENHPDYATSLNNLATLYDNMGQYAKAEPLYIESMAIRKKALGENHPDYATSLNNVAFLYENMGQYAKAEPLYSEAMSIWKKVLGENHPDYATSLNNLAGLYEGIGHYAKAEPLYNEAMSIRKKALGENHPDYATSLNNQAVLYDNMGQYAKAEPLILQSSEIILKNLLSNFSSFSEKEKEEYLANTISLLETNNSFLYNYRKASTSIIQNNFNKQLVLKSLILSDSRNVLALVEKSNDTVVKKSLKDWQTNKNILSKQYSLPVSNRRTDLMDIENATEGLEKELNRKSSEFRCQQNAIRISLQDVQKNLQQEEVAIEFVSFKLYNKKWTDSIMYAAYILHKNDSAPMFVPLCEEKQLQKIFDSAGTTATAMVSKFYRGLDIKNKNAAGTLGTELYKLIWQPLEPYLKNVKKVSYSPAGKLYSIAFHALPVDSATVLMDKYQLQQYTSTRQVVLREQAKKNSKPQNITLFGNATFTMDSLQIVKGKTKTENIATNIYTPQNRGTRGGTWSSLPGTAQEVKTIQQVFQQNKITTKTFTQTTASEENLKALSGNSPQILHIATHGFFLPEPNKKRKENNFNNENTYTLADDPLLRSGLILSGGNYAWSGKTPIDGVEDGIATAYEISQLNLSNTELVVLSACETALGDVKGSEGVFGLQRAFKMAGVKKMIVSLWQVPDKETAELMTTFYTYWMKGKGINDAFTQAQADMRKKYSPFYWAAFILVE